MDIWIIIIITAIILDLIIGDPNGFPHPIIFIGKLIQYLFNKLNKYKKNRRLLGFILFFLSISIVITSITILLYLMIKININLYYIISLYFLYSLLAAGCLKNEVKKIYYSLNNDDIVKSRTLIGYLVGRDTDKLSKDDIIRATVETTAENTIDGIIAPLFYIFIGIFFGCPVQLLFLYKTVNTLDSMVGYKQEPYTDIGYASAKIDDLFNFIPARIGSVFMMISGLILPYDFKNGIKMFIRDRRNHSSPNSAHPESVVAGLLNIQLGGSNTYFGEIINKPSIGDMSKEIDENNILQTINIMIISEILFAITFITIIIFLKG